MHDYDDEQRTRNRGIVPSAVARTTAGKTVAIAGVGGVGGLTAVYLARQLKLKRLKLADFDTFDRSNLNRQHGAYDSTLGKEKLKRIADECRDVDKLLEVVDYNQGVTTENIDEFLAGVDILLNAIDYKAPEVYLALTRRATELGIPIIVGAEVGYGTRVVWFKPGGMTYEQYFRLRDGQPLNLGGLIMSVPSYADTNALGAVLREEIEAPAIAVGGLFTAGTLIRWIEAVLSDIDVPRAAPYSRMVDEKAGQIGYIRWPRTRLVATGLWATLRTRLGLNAPAL